MKRIYKILLGSLILVSFMVAGYFLYRNQTIEYIVSQTEKAVFYVTTFKDGKPYSSGSGFFMQSDELSEDAVFGVTNVHVIKGSDSIMITTNNHRSFQVTDVSYYSESSDLFLFQWSFENIDINDLRYLELEVGVIEKGQSVFAVSHPKGFDYSFSSGNVASIRDFDVYGTVVQTTTPISAGSSGSPLLSSRGKAIGVNTFSYVDGQSLNFAVRLDHSTIQGLTYCQDRSLSDLLFDLGHSIRIGEQVWMDVNLNVSHFRNGDIIPEAKTSEEWYLAGKEGRPVWAYPRSIGQDDVIRFLEKLEGANIASNKNYGKLYNWFAVSDERGLAPEGWKIPSAYDWDDLINHLGGWRYATSKALKSTTDWEYYDIRSNSYRGISDDTNESGFSALPSGSIDAEGRTDGIGRHTEFWSTTESDKGAKLRYCISLNIQSLTLNEKGDLARSPQIDLVNRYIMDGHPVRCLKEE